MSIKVVVVGNCQARPFSILLEKAFVNIDVVCVAIVHLLKNDSYDEYKAIFDDSDFVITQNIADNYPCEFVRTSILKNLYGEKLILIPNLFYRGYTPELRYVRLGSQGTLKGPLGDYHHETILQSYLMGLSTKNALELMKSPDYWLRQYGNVHQESLSELIKREYFVDVKVTGELREMITQDRLFFTFNHPSVKLIYLMTEKLSNILGFTKDLNFSIDDINESLDLVITPINKSAQDLLGLNFNEAPFYKGLAFQGDNAFFGEYIYSECEIVESFYKHYDSNIKLIDDYVR